MRRSLTAADIGLVLLVLAVCAVAFIVDALSGQTLRNGARVVVGLLFAVGMAALWLALFYRQDRVEQEPKHLVASVLVLSALGAGAVSEPLIRLAPDPEGPYRWVVAFLVVGILREFTKYLAVRLVAVPPGDVNERADGVIYGTAAGLGYALAMNVTFVIEAGGGGVAPGFAWMTAIILLHATLGGFIGYLVARDHLEPVAAWWLPAGLLVAAAIDAIVFEARFLLVSAVDSPGVSAALGSWLGVGLALAVAALITVLLIRAMHREESA